MNQAGWTAELTPRSVSLGNLHLQISTKKHVPAMVREHCYLQPALTRFYHPGSTTTGDKDSFSTSMD